MDQEKIDRLARRIVTHDEPAIELRRAARRRRRAARRLARAGSPEAAAALARAVATTAVDAASFWWVRDDALMAIARRAFAGATDQGVIDAVCAVWADTRDAMLGELVEECGWVAGKPATARALTAAVTGRLDALAADGPDVARALVAVADDEPPPLRDRAAAALATLRREDAREAVCELAVESGSPAALEAALAFTAGGFAPADPARRAVLLFLGGRFDAYAALDFDGSLLRSVQAGAHPRLRARLAERARESGRAEWLRAFTGARGEDRLEAATEDEWEAALAMLVAGGRWEELWHLALRARPSWSARALRELGRGPWQPEDPAERDGYERLAGLAGACPEVPPSGTVFDRLRDIDGPYYSGRTYPAFGLSPDGGFAALSGTARARYGDGSRVMMWRVPSGEPVAHVTGIPGQVSHLALTPGGGLLVTSDDEDGALRTWELPSGRPAGLLHDRRGGNLAVTPDGSLLAGTDHWAVNLWHLPSGAPAARLEAAPPGNPLPGHIGALRSLAIAPDASLLAAGDDHGRVHLWRLPAGEPAGVLEGHRDGVSGLALTRDGLLAAATYFRGVRLWRLPSRTPVGVLDTPNGSTSVAVTPDGSVLLVGGRGLDTPGVGLWRLPSGEAAGTLGPDSPSVEVAVTPDGGTVVTADSGRVTFWRSALHEIAGTPVGAIDPAAVERCRRLDGGDRAVRAWLDLVSALVRWRHRHDVEVDDAARVAGRTDIEVDP